MEPILLKDYHGLKTTAEGEKEMFGGKGITIDFSPGPLQQRQVKSKKTIARQFSSLPKT